MLFDKLCGLTGCHLPQLIPTLEQTALFHFPGRPHEFLTAQRDQIDYDQANEFFYLPFPVVALEDDASVCILMDSEKDQLGLKGRRYFLDMMSTDTDSSNFNWRASDMGISQEDVTAAKKEMAGQFNNPYVINCGYLEEMHYKGNPPQISIKIESEGNFDRSTIDTKVKETLLQIGAEIKDWTEE